MSPHGEALPSSPLGGRLLTRPTLILAAIAAFGIALAVWRFYIGLGATTGLSDGYPWGIWIAYDVVTGTAFACGGYAVAILVYVLNRGHYHPLVRPAVLTSALGYTMAGISVMIDVGRPWVAWRLPWPGNWNTHSVLLEVAMCIMAYTIVLWLELAPAFLERAKHPVLKQLYVISNKSLPWLLALGLLLPTMHQSSLGSLMLIAQTKLHPLWHTPLLPLLFLVSVVGMGYGAVVIEAVVSALVFKRAPERPLLSKLSRIIPWIAMAWIALRLGDLALRGRMGLILGSGWLSGFFCAEMALMVTASVILLEARRDEVVPLSRQFRAAVLLLAGGALYRFDTFLVAYDPGRGWHYFPAAQEIMVTVGIIAFEIAAYGVAVKLFPILSGRPLKGVGA